MRLLLICCLALAAPGIVDGKCKDVNLSSDPPGRKSFNLGQGGFKRITVLRQLDGSQECDTLGTDYGLRNERILFVDNGCKGVFRICKGNHGNNCMNKELESESTADEKRVNGLGEIKSMVVKELRDDSVDCNGKYSFTGNRVFASDGCKAKFTVCDAAGAEDTGNNQGDQGQTCLEVRLTSQAGSRTNVNPPVDNFNTMTLKRELQGSTGCTKNDNWGHTPNKNKLFASKGCMAVFTVCKNRGRFQPLCRDITIRSGTPSTDTKNLNDIGNIVSMVVEEEQSDRICVMDITFGFQGKTVRASNGCRAKFKVCGAGSGDGGQKCETVTASSWQHQRDEKTVRPLARIDSIEKVKQFSNAECKKGDSFNVEGNKIKVNKGCRALFKVCGPDNADHDEDAEKAKFHQILKDLFGGGNIEEIIQRLKQNKKDFFTDKCTCIGWGDPHIITFDQVTHHFQGICEYTMVKIKENVGTCNFEVTAEMENRNGKMDVSFIKAVHITMFGHSIALLKDGRFLVDDEEIFSHYTDENNNFEITTGGNTAVTFTARACSVRVTYKANERMEVVVSKTFYAGRMQGLCGNCNGLKDDEYLYSDGTEPDAQKLIEKSALIGKSYQVSVTRDGAPPSCDTTPNPPVDGCSDDDMREAEAECALLLDAAGPFANCKTGKRSQAYDGCVSDVCSFLHKRSVVNELVCSAYETLTELCAEDGDDVGNWKLEGGCVEECGENSFFSEFVPKCPPSCSNESPEGECATDVSEGCFCNQNFLLSGNKCVPKNKCGCKKRNRYYPIGAWSMDRQCQNRLECVWNEQKGEAEVQRTAQTCGENEVCKRVNGRRECVCDKNFKREEGTDKCVKDEDEEQKEEEQKEEDRDTRNSDCVCGPWGDVHYARYDGGTVHFQGICTYLISQTPTMTEKCDFSISAKNEHRGNNRRVSFLRTVYVTISGVNIIIDKGRIVKVEGAVVATPWINRDKGLTITEVGNFVQVISDECNVVVRFDGIKRMSVRVPKDQAGDLIGMCGNCDGVRDPFVTKDGEDVSRDREKFMKIGNSWRVMNPENLIEHKTCEQTEPEKECTAAEIADIRSKSKCGRILDPEGPFKDCIQQFLPDKADTIASWVSGCEMDACNFYDDPNELTEMLCATNELLAGECAKFGIIVTWRSAEFCPMTCTEPNSHYNPLMSGCQPTCLDPEPTGFCNAEEVEGCECNDGLVLDNGHCIDKEQCGCFDPLLGYIPRGTTRISADCTTKYTCEPAEVGSTLTTETVNHRQCGDNAVCKLNGDSNPECECIEGYDGDGFTCTEIVTPPVDPDPVDPPVETGTPCSCTAWGDPHIDQCDGGDVQVHPPCKFVMSAFGAKGDQCYFQVEIKNQRSATSVMRASVRMVDVKLNGYVFRFQQNRVFSVKDESAAIPTFQTITVVDHFTIADLATVTQEGEFVQLVTACGVKVTFNGIGIVNVGVHSNFQNQLRGLCGNFDGDKLNDRVDALGRRGPDFDNQRDFFDSYVKQFLLNDDSDDPNSSVECVPVS